ncbi:unnamed protein product [Rotaria magnacalcarata]|uniref:Uncharacterized protein n=1 Tax=Rotaria magnacalcarata TaxID=392030 RepID=A0A8S2N0J1_9BILA|nr:unnamed protein product [Rotaria magnacalcarata]
MSIAFTAYTSAGYGRPAVIVLIALFFFESVMFPTIFVMDTANLDRRTAGFLIMEVSRDAVFPSISYGFSCAESTNFALEHWIEYARTRDRTGLPLSTIDYYSMDCGWTLPKLDVTPRQSYLPHMSNADISRYLYEPKLHKIRSIPENEDATAQSMVAKHSTQCAGQIAFRLSKKDIKISKITLRKIFKDVGVHSIKPTLKPLLTSDDIFKKDSSEI